MKSPAATMRDTSTYSALMVDTIAKIDYKLHWTFWPMAKSTRDCKNGY